MDNVAYAKFKDALPAVVLRKVTQGRLLYVYTNGYVLPNVPDIQGGILNNDTAMRWEDWVADNPLEPVPDDARRVCPQCQGRQRGLHRRTEEPAGGVAGRGGLLPVLRSHPLVALDLSGKFW